MAKKKKQNYLKYGIIALGIIGAVMSLLNFVNFGKEYAYTGIQVMFGYSKTVDLGLTKATTEFLSFSILAFLIVALPLLASFGALLKNKLLRLICALIMIAGAIFCFFVPNFIVYANEVQQLAHELFAKSLGIGAILSGAMFGLGGLCSLFAIAKN